MREWENERKRRIEKEREREREREVTHNRMRWTEGKKCGRRWLGKTAQDLKGRSGLFVEGRRKGKNRGHGEGGRGNEQQG